MAISSRETCLSSSELNRPAKSIIQIIIISKFIRWKFMGQQLIPDEPWRMHDVMEDSFSPFISCVFLQDWRLLWARERRQSRKTEANIIESWHYIVSMCSLGFAIRSTSILYISIRKRTANGKISFDPWQCLLPVYRTRLDSKNVSHCSAPSVLDVWLVALCCTMASVLRDDRPVIIIFPVHCQLVRILKRDVWKEKNGNVNTPLVKEKKGMYIFCFFPWYSV